MTLGIYQDIENQPPTSLFFFQTSSDRTKPFEVSFNGSMSSDPDGDSLSYNWDFGDENGSQVGPEVTHSYMDYGTYSVTLTVTDSKGGHHSSTQVITVADLFPPEITIHSPTQGQEFVQGSEIVVSGDADETLSLLEVNGQSATLSEDGLTFSFHTSFSELGAQTLQIVGRDLAGNHSAPQTINIQIIEDPVQPPVSVISVNRNSGEAPLLVLFDGSSSVDPQGGPLTFHWDFGDGQVSTESVTSHYFDSVGNYTVSLIVTNSTGASHSSSVQILAEAIVVPEAPVDPTPIESPVTLRSPGEALSFLYEGPNPIQVGVAQDVISTERASGVSGFVRLNDGSPLAGVKIQIKDQPEYGYTYSRADGAFDFVFNGGDPVTLEFSRSGYPEVLRKVRQVWNDHFVLDPVVMMAYDSKVSRVNMNSSSAVLATSSPTLDESGQRNVKVMIPANTQAQIVRQDGTQVNADRLSIRMTEYTVGANGQNAMPAPLPSSSGYTYAVELSADEAVAIGAKSINFSQPLPVFIDNFLDFPVGEHVPVGYLDRERGEWIPDHDGLIIKILGVTNGLADLDFNGDSQPASSADLLKVGVTDDERRLLADNYAVGKTLWRVPVTHFTPFDCNWPFGPPNDSMNPPGGGPPGGQDGAGKQPPGGNLPPEFFDGNDNQNNNSNNNNNNNQGRDREPNQCEMGSTIIQGSSIEVFGQVLREDLFLEGLPVSLHYRSDRVEGYGKKSLRVRVTESSGGLPIKAEVILDIVGQQIKKEILNPGYDLFTEMEWDGLDRFGRRVYGATQGRITIRYYFDAVYYGIDSEAGADADLDFRNSFAIFPPLVRIIAVRPERQIAVENSYLVTLENSKSISIKKSFGGWTPSTWHSYEPRTEKVFLGDGTAYSAGWLDGVVLNVAGRPGVCGSDVDGPALEMAICDPGQLEVAGDGTIYFINPGSQAVEKITRDGQKVRVIGDGSLTFGADGTLAINSGIPFGIRDIKISPNGDLYLLVASYLKRIDKNGVLWSVAGDGTPAITGDGGPAIDAQITNPLRMAVDSSGNIYLAGTQSQRVRKINISGIIDTINSKTPTGVSNGDGGPLAQATFGSLQAIAVGPSDELYIADSNVIRKVTNDGMINTIAGDGQYDLLGNGVKALEASFGYNIEDLAVDPVTGWLYITEWSSVYAGISKGSSIRRILGDGTIETVIGSGTEPISGTNAAGYNGEGLSAYTTKLSNPSGVAFAPNGEIVLSDTKNHLIRKIVPSKLPDLVLNHFVVPSQSGSELYVFDKQGLHLETRSALTNAVLLSFEYDTNNMLVAQADAFGKRTQFHRSIDGQLESIEGPEGRSYAIYLNPDGWMQSVSNPLGETYNMDYWGTDGLLKEFRRPKGGYSKFTYDIYGKLTRDENSEGEFITLADTSIPEEDRIFRMLTTLPGGQQTSYSYEQNTSSQGQLSITSVDGTNSVGEAASTKRKIISKTGTVTSLELAPDPRFGMTAPYEKRFIITLPSGLQKSQETDIRAQFSGANLTSLTYQTSTNGIVSQSVFTQSTGEILSTSSLGRSRSVIIDGLERPIDQHTPGVVSTNFTYTPEGRLDMVTQGVRFSKNTYYASGFLESVTNALNQQTFFDYDAVGRLTQTTLPDGRIIGFRYDINGNLIGITPPGRAEHGFIYNSIDLNTGYNPPLLGAVSAPTTYEYDLEKKLTAIHRPDGKDITYVYNPINKRLTSIVTSLGSYTFGYNNISGQVTIQNSPTGEHMEFSYDGHLVDGVLWSGTVNGQVDYVYDNFFRVASVLVNGSAINYGFDDDGLLVSAGSATYDRDPQNGLLTGVHLGGQTDTVTYNVFGEVETYSNNLISWSYERDNLGRITKKTETISGSSKIYEYHYDLSGRLDEVKIDGAIQRSYQFDSNGNRLSINNGPQNVIDAQDRLTSDEKYNYTYNLNGDLETKTDKITNEQTSYVYDEFGNLREVTLANGDVITYIIDAENRRIGKKLNGTLVYGLLYEDALNPIALLNPDGTVKSRFVYGSKGNVPDYLIQSREIYKIVSDHLGSVRFVQKVSDSTITQIIDYDEFGKVLSDSNPGFQIFGFAGGIYDTDTRLVRFGARDYSPESGRWTSKDSTLYLSGDTNFYGYVFSDPINLLDTEGESARSPALGGNDYLTGGGRVSAGGYIGAGAIIGAITNVFSQRGNNRIGIDEEQRRYIEERLKDPTLSKKERNELKKKIKKDDKAQGKRRRRQGGPGNEKGGC
ncbi:MAG: PKD domain-containing protein [Bdellovibrionales bacterium]|nr:PKD domain-containing protein [Bdellovibrionales bacterium]